MGPGGTPARALVALIAAVSVVWCSAAPAKAAAPAQAADSVQVRCEISQVPLVVQVPFDATVVSAGAGPGGVVLDVTGAFPELPITVTVDSTSIRFPVPVGIASVDSVTFSGGNLSGSWELIGGDIVVTFSGSQASDAVDLPLTTVTATVSEGTDPSTIEPGAFSRLESSTEVGTATCVPSDEPAPPPLTPPTPDTDPFYTAPAGFETQPPGTVLRTRPSLVRAFGTGVNVKATQALFTTTDTAGAPVVTVTTLLRSPFPYTRGDRPLVAYQVAIDGLGAKCQPSHTFSQDAGLDMVLLLQLLLRGYDVVVTDYEGPRYAYGAGPVLAHATLDGIRAAESLPGTGLAGARTPIALWGYSGGAIASGWAAESQPTYAPELNLKAVASGGTPADLLATARYMDGSLVSGYMLLVALAITREYPYFSLAFNDKGRLLATELADACSDAVFEYPFKRLGEYVVITDPLHNPLLVKVMDQTKLGRIAPSAPVFLYHGTHDEGIPFAEAVALKADWCAAGADVTLYADHISEHILTPIVTSWRAIAFITDRFNGVPAASECS